MPTLAALMGAILVEALALVDEGNEISNHRPIEADVIGANITSSEVYERRGIC